MTSTDPQPAESFAQQAARGQRGVIGELWDFLRHNKKWWLIPIVAVLVIVGAIILLGGTAAAPFIYTLF